MFERLIPLSRDTRGSEIDGEVLVGHSAQNALRSGGALRALDWSEITARLDAARDLRELVRGDSHHAFHDGAASFGDAAARYFRAIEEREEDVNLGALEQGKACGGSADNSFGETATGDARDVND